MLGGPTTRTTTATAAATTIKYHQQEFHLHHRRRLAPVRPSTLAPSSARAPIACGRRRRRPPPGLRRLPCGRRRPRRRAAAPAAARNISPHSRSSQWAGGLFRAGTCAPPPSCARSGSELKKIPFECARVWRDSFRGTFFLQSQSRGEVLSSEGSRKVLGRERRGEEAQLETRVRVPSQISGAAVQCLLCPT